MSMHGENRAWLRASGALLPLCLGACQLHVPTAPQPQRAAQPPPRVGATTLAQAESSPVHAPNPSDTAPPCPSPADTEALHQQWARVHGAIDQRCSPFLLFDEQHWLNQPAYGSCARALLVPPPPIPPPGPMPDPRPVQRGWRIIHYWSTTCPPCVKELPRFIKLADEWIRQGIKVEMVAAETAESIQARRAPALLAKMGGAHLSQREMDFRKNQDALPRSVIFRGGIQIRILRGVTVEQEVTRAIDSRRAR